MMERAEKRRDRRLGARFGILCHAVGSTANKSCDGHTVNVSSGGLYFETTGTFEPGSLLHVELSIPPTPGLLEFGGRIAGFARVLRA
ncbi:MAG: PilZ domain-containing protein, partial [Planctomycetota bacterium]